MKFLNVDAAQEWSTKHNKMIYVEIEGVTGILQVYPGGRKVLYAKTMGKVYERWKRRLTPDSEFKNAR